MVIREEKPGEFGAIYDLVKTAFATARVKDGDEQDYVDALRKGDGYIPALALVAEEDGGLAGHIMLTRVKLATDDDRAVKCLLLAPLSVVLECRSRGVGAALTREALRRAAAMGYEAVFLVGDPAYYSRFGFRRAAEFGVEYTGNIPAEVVQALELKPGALAMTGVDDEIFGLKKE